MGRKWPCRASSEGLIQNSHGEMVGKGRREKMQRSGSCDNDPGGI